MKYRISQVVGSMVGADSYGNTHTTVTLEGINQPVYIVHQPKNTPQQGQEVEGGVAPDRNGRLKFTRQQLNQQPRSYSQPTQQGSQNSGSTFNRQTQVQQVKADPAKSDSIENQSYYKQAIDLIRIHAEFNSDKYANKELRELNDLAISEAHHAKMGMRNPAQSSVQTVFPNSEIITSPDQFPADTPPITAYENDPEAGWKQ